MRILYALVIVLMVNLPVFAGTRQPAQNTFTLWQLPPQTHSQILSYVIQTTHGRLIVIDGGVTGDASYLDAFLIARGGEVEAWFITHPHPDHIEALTEILNKYKAIKINRIYASLPTQAWVSDYEPYHLPSLNNFNTAMHNANRTPIDLAAGAKFEIDHVHIQVLGIKNPEITANAINNSSVVLRVWDTSKSVLFLADLGAEGGRKLLNGNYGKLLKSDYVQMANHGQNGVDKDVYEAVHSKYCLWPTPEWMWNNNDGGNAGQCTVSQVCTWMNELGVQRNYIMKDGICRID